MNNLHISMKLILFWNKFASLNSANLRVSQQVVLGSKGFTLQQYLITEMWLCARHGLIQLFAAASVEVFTQGTWTQIAIYSIINPRFCFERKIRNWGEYAYRDWRWAFSNFIHVWLTTVWEVISRECYSISIPFIFMFTCVSVSEIQCVCVQLCEYS